MKKHALLIFLVLALWACNQNPESSVDAKVTSSEMAFYGDTISPEGAVDPKTFLTEMTGKDTLYTKLAGTVNATCQMKGCWMTMDMENGEEMRVRFKDYGFFVPTEGVSGKTAIIEGKAFTDTLSVDHLKHLAEDAGKSEEEIAAISEPEVSVNFEATGVIIRD